MKSIIALFLFINLNIIASDNVCEQMVSEENENNIVVLGEVNVLTKEAWYKTDVVLNFSYEECFEAVTQELIEFNGVKYYRFRTTEDHCDGGNTYGSIYSYDLKTPIAHIYDTDTYCKSDWNAEEMYSNNKCNTLAMAEAEKKMKEFGLSFQATHARVELRDPYIYDFIHIEGNLTEGDKKPVQLRALVETKSCKISTISISSLTL